MKDLKVLTVNVNSHATLLQALRAGAGQGWDVILVQEIRVVQESVAVFRTQLAGLGWKCECLPSPRSGTGAQEHWGGVAILWATHIGMTSPPGGWCRGVCCR